MDDVLDASTREPTLKAAPSDQLFLLDLQAHDASLAQVEHRRRTLPELAALADLDEKVRDLDGRRIELQTAVDDLRREQRKAEAEVQQVRDRRSRDEDRLGSGVITSPKDLESLQHELVALQRRIGTLEDAQLEVMEKVEEAEGQLNVVVADLAQVRVEVAQLEAGRDAALAELADLHRTAVADRDSTASIVPNDLLALYDKARAQYGSGAAALRAGRCEGCRLELNGADLREIAAAAEDEVLRCPECGRILVRTNESGL